MNWDAIGAVGEILGAAAVLITLLYLATQVKQTNKIARFNSTRELMGQFDDLNRLVVTDAGLRQILAKEGELSDDEREQLYSFANMYCNVWSTAQTAFDQGQLEAGFFASALKDVGVELRRWPNFRRSVERWPDNYPELGEYEIFRPVRVEK